MGGIQVYVLLASYFDPKREWMNSIKGDLQTSTDVVGTLPRHTQQLVVERQLDNTRPSGAHHHQNLPEKSWVSPTYNIIPEFTQSLVNILISSLTAADAST